MIRQYFSSNYHFFFILEDMGGTTRLMCERIGRSSLHDYKPPRPPPPNFNKLQNKKGWFNLQ